MRIRRFFITGFIAASVLGTGIGAVAASAPSAVAAAHPYVYMHT